MKSKILLIYTMLTISFTATAHAKEAQPTSQTLLINGESVSQPVYNIDGNNYFRLRDLAYELNFGCTYNGTNNSIELDTSSPYTDDAPKSIENLTKEHAQNSSQTVYLNGNLCDIKAYNINGNNYFKVRDLAKAVNFGCIYNSSVNGIEIDNKYEYSEGDVFGASKLMGEMSVHFLDVGQGDSIFIELPDGRTMLIDASISKFGDRICEYIKNEGHSDIDILVATHPHADHIGGMKTVTENFDIQTVYMPEAESTSKTYKNLMAAFADKNTEIKTARNGVNIYHSDVLDISIVAPCRDDYDNLNNHSAVIMLDYGDSEFLLTGDAEEESENDITADVSADVAKAGHHGSRTSSTEEFIRKVNAQYVVMSLGEGNSYGHPHEEAVNRWKKAGAKILRTDINGDITFTTDGIDIDVSCSESNEFAYAKTGFIDMLLSFCKNIAKLIFSTEIPQTTRA